MASAVRGKQGSARDALGWHVVLLGGLTACTRSSVQTGSPAPNLDAGTGAVARSDLASRPSPAPTVCPKGMLSVPGGRYKLLARDGDAVTVQPFCMDVTEVTTDLAGNVDEWTSIDYGGRHPGAATTRGGSWLEGRLEGQTVRSSSKFRGLQSHPFRQSPLPGHPLPGSGLPRPASDRNQVANELIAPLERLSVTARSEVGPDRDSSEDGVRCAR